MLPNLGALAGRTIFITGASRGIGKAIALKCARDGANIVIAAKTTTPHPKLPGTIYTAAKEVEDAGGKCLPCEVDIRDEEQVRQAVEKAVAHFGGIDILVNNASAIHLTGTEVTPMKRFDLMMGVNARGTFVCSKHCIPHLRNSKNGHILNISPPLSMKSKWFRSHVAYTMAKYGMSMCALGMAEELGPDGIAVNTLWPRTAIYTAAMEMLGEGMGAEASAVKEQCRSPDIMADAAYAILRKDSRGFTGHFCIDDEVLAGEGVKDFSPYNYVANPNLMLDFFLEEPGPAGTEIKTAFTVDPSSPALGKSVEPARPSQAAAGVAAGAGGSNAELATTFRRIESLLSADLVKSVGGRFQFELKGEPAYFIDLKSAPAGWAGPAGPSVAHKPDVTMTLDAKDFIKMFAGQLNPTSAFMSGKLKIKGDLGLAMKLEKLLKQGQAKL